MTKPHLLVVDDDVQILRAAERTLSRHFVVRSAPDAETALAMSDGGAIFDVILCDLRLPGMSGREFHEQLRLRSSALAARLVIISGAAPAADDAFDTMLGPRRLMKPCPLQLLTATLRKVAVLPAGAPPRAPPAAA